MKKLTDHDFDKIVVELDGLEKRLDHSERANFWRTASELLPLVQKEGALEDAKTLDVALRTRFLSDDQCVIRPAYYPSENSCERFWGHISKVGFGPEREKLRETLDMQPLTLEADGLGIDAP